MFCPNCGKQLPDNAKFCNGCGAQQIPTAPAEPVKPVVGVYAEPVKPVKAKKKFPIWVVIVALVLVAALVTALVLPSLDLGGTTSSGNKTSSKDKDNDDDDEDDDNKSSGGKSMYALTEVTMYSYGELDVHVVLSYDSEGHLVQVTNEDGYGDSVEITFSYDEKGYVVEKNYTDWYGDTYVTEYEYEMDNGLMTTSKTTFADGAETEIEYEYEDGVLIRENMEQDGSYHPVFGYDNDGDCSYTYTDEGLVAQLDLYNEYYEETMVIDYSYNSDGKMVYADRDGYSEAWEYDDAGNLIPNNSELEYTFDANGNLIRIELKEDDTCYIEFTYERVSTNKHNRLANEFVKNLCLGNYLEMPLYNSPYMLYFYDLFQEME